MSPQTSSLDAAWYFFPVMAGMIGCGASKALEQNGNFNQKTDGTIGCGGFQNGEIALTRKIRDGSQSAHGTWPG